MKKLPALGMRIIKTAIAVGICTTTFTFLDRENATLAAIASIIALQNTIETSFKSGGNRIISTILGGIWAIGFMYIGHLLPSLLFRSLIVPIGICIIIYVCAAIDKKELITISCVVFLSITLNYTETANSLMYAINRIIDTAYGVIVSIVINVLIKSPEKKEEEKAEVNKKD